MTDTRQREMVSEIERRGETIMPERNDVREGGGGRCDVRIRNDVK
jgi:hypothetical protein